MIEVGKKYNERTLRRIKQFYKVFSKLKWSTLSTILSWSHYTELLAIKDKNKLMCCLNIVITHNLSVRELREKIKSNEYERLPKKTKAKLINKEEPKVEVLFKNRRQIQLYRFITL